MEAEAVRDPPADALAMPRARSGGGSAEPTDRADVPLRRHRALLGGGGRSRFPSGALRRNRSIDDQQLLERVRALRAQRYTPAEIARSLAIGKSEAARLVRMVAIESGTGTGEAGGETLCWVDPGWRHRLRIEGHNDWPDDPGAPSKAGDSGVALVLLAEPNGV